MNNVEYMVPKVPRQANQKVKTTLKMLIKILKDLKIKYRIWGSIIPAAIFRRLHRPLGDIDILIDEKDLEDSLDKIKENNFKINKREIKIFGLVFPWIEAETDKVSPLTIFYGHFDKHNNFEVALSKRLKLVIAGKIIKPTKYSLFGIEFIGVPKETACLGVYRSRFSSKRKYEVPIMESVVKPSEIPYKREVELYFNNIKVPLFGIIYDFLQHSRNIIGKIRVFFGKPYDFW